MENSIRELHINEYGLPTHLEVPLSLIGEYSFIDPEEEKDEIISDFLSNHYGFCHNGFFYREQPEKMSVFIFDIDWDIDDEEDEEEPEHKGYSTNSGFKGWIGGGYMLFATEEEYEEYLEGKEEGFNG